MPNNGSIEISKIHITPEDVNVIVQKATSDSTVKVLGYKLINNSGDILGILTLQSYLKVNIQRPGKKTEETLNCFVKSFKLDNSVKTNFLIEYSIFERESYVYNTVIPLFTSNYDIKKWSPTCYLANKDVIVLEDLKSQGYQVHHTFFDNYELLKSAITTIASFHSSSILAEAHLNRDLEHPIPLNERFPELISETIFSDSEFTRSWFDSGAVAASNIAKYLSKDPENVRQKFSRFHDIIKPSKTHRSVILHSDLWKNNIMFDESKPLPNCILIDFQTTKYGPLVLDLLQLLHLNSSPAYRAKFEKELVDHYHSVLEETVRRNDPSASIPTREEIDLGLQEFRIFGIILPCLYFPVVMLNPEILSTILAGNKNSVDNVMINDRTDLILENFEKDERYKTRVVEAITELVNWQKLDD